METSILVSGFNAAESMHGSRYMKVVGDGDSSVLCNIQEQGTQFDCADYAIINQY